MYFDHQYLERIKSSANLLNLIGSFVKLKKLAVIMLVYVLFILKKHLLLMLIQDAVVIIASVVLRVEML